jgi:hypothetical protein
MIPLPIDTSRLNYQNVQNETSYNEKIKFKILLYIIVLYVILSHPYITIFINNIYYYFMKTEYIYYYEWSILSSLFLGCLFAFIIFISFS